MYFLLISASLNKKSRSFVLARTALEIFQAQHKKAELIDLRDYDLPLCDAGAAFGHAQVVEIKQKIEQATAIIVSAPVYNYDMNAALKNIYDLTGSAWEGKLVGLMAVGGGKGSYMAPMNFLNGLMLNARCLIVPRYVYALEQDIEGRELKNEEIRTRIQHLVRQTINLSEKLFPPEPL